MPVKGQRHYGYLLNDQSVRRWYDNVARGSRITADVYLRRLGGFLESEHLTHNEIVRMNKKTLFNLLLDTVSQMERAGYAGGYIHSVIKAVKSWLQFNNVETVGKIKIKGAEETPTLADEKVPSQSELGRILNEAPLREKVAIALIATCGGRMEVLGNYDGSDGLRVRDLPEMVVDTERKTVEFYKIPTVVVVRTSISKARHQYFTFLCEEGCEYMEQYLEQRMRIHGEVLSPDSPIIIRCDNWQSKKFKTNGFITTVNIGDRIRFVMRKAGFRQRPYVLRSYFDSRLLVAEAEGQILRDFRVFFMGHKGDIEYRYTLNKQRLPSDLVEKLRESYKKSQKYLQTITPISLGEDIPTQIRRQMLLTVGYKEDEVGKLNLAEVSDDQIQDLIRRKLFATMMNNGQRQKVVSAPEVEKLMAERWEWIGNLADGRAILRLPLVTA